MKSTIASHRSLSSSRRKAESLASPCLYCKFGREDSRSQTAGHNDLMPLLREQAADMNAHSAKINTFMIYSIMLESRMLIGPMLF